MKLFKQNFSEKVDGKRVGKIIQNYIFFLRAPFIILGMLGKTGVVSKCLVLEHLPKKKLFLFSRTRNFATSQQTTTMSDSRGSALSKAIELVGIVELFDKFWLRQIKAAHEDAFGCWNSHLKTHHKGYVQVAVFRSIDGKQHKVNVFLHHLAYWSIDAENTTHCDFNKDGLVISHCCSNTCCLNPDHLTIEDQETNESRKYCTWINKTHPELEHKCIHEPKCIIRK